MIVLRTPKGWTCPKEIDGKRTEDYWRSHQVPMGEMHENPAHVRILEQWMKSYRPAELFDDDGRLRPELAELAPRGDAPHERQPAHQRRPAAARPAAAGLPRLRRRGARARRRHRRVDPRHGQVPARRDEAEPGGAELPAVQPRREQLEPLAGRARGHQPRLGRRDLSVRRPPRARRAGDGDAERAPVPGLARGLSADRPARLLLLLRGVHPHHRLDVQPARQVAEGVQPHPLAAADRLAQLPAVEPRLAAGPQRLQPPGPRLHRPRRQQEGRGRPRLSAARRQLPAVGHRPLPAQPQLRQRRRRRQAAGAAVADDGRGDQALRRPGSASGSGPATTAAASPTS